MSIAADTTTTTTTISPSMTTTMTTTTTTTTSANEILQVLTKKTKTRKQSTKPKSQWAQFPTRDMLLDFVIETFVSKVKKSSIISSNITIASSKRDGTNRYLVTI
jgi:hypothetical protein